MSTTQFRELNNHDRALVAVAVLLDGIDAASYLELDSDKGAALRAAAMELAKLEPDMRMPFVGTMLRLALEEAGVE
jgi:hypothetical protein